MTENQRITKILDDTVQHGGKIVIGTDWHLYQYDKKTGVIAVNPTAKANIQLAKSLLSERDLFLFLGDIADAEYNGVEAEANIRDIFAQFNCKKILVLGNNDRIGNDDLPEERRTGFYETVFDYVVTCFVWRSMLFSHCSMAGNDETLNIHGHMHRMGTATRNITYYGRFDNQVNVCALGRTTTLDEVLKLSTYWRHMAGVSEGQEKPGFTSWLIYQAWKEYRKIKNAG